MLEKKVTQKRFPEKSIVIRIGTSWRFYHLFKILGGGKKEGDILKREGISLKQWKSQLSVIRVSF